MIEVQDNSGLPYRLIVTANRSMSWKANLYLAASLAAISMTIAIIMATFGLWMVIPFAGLEALFLVGCLYLTLKRLSRQEVITVSDEEILLEWGYNQPDESVSLPRQWSKLSYSCKENPFEVGELALTAHGKRYILGKCLNRDEKKRLYLALQRILGAARHPKIV